MIEPQRKLKGPFDGSEFWVDIGLSDELAISSDLFLKPLLGEFIS